jgi:hypothetical protein
MDPFLHFPIQRVVVCSMCKHTVLPSSIDMHLREKDKDNMPQEERTHITQQIQTIERLITSRAELNRLVFPLASSPPISELQPPRRDGMQCGFKDENSRSCRFISCHEDQIRKHCWEEHGWKNKHKGRPNAGQKKKFHGEAGSIASIFSSVDQEPSFSRFKQ